MPLLETLMIDLGASITKSMLKMWLKTDMASDASASVIDTVKSLVTDTAIQRRAQRQLEEIGDKVGENLLPIFERDGANLDEGSRSAIALAVADTLNTLSGKVLAQFNLAPNELAKYLNKHSLGTQHFNETELSLFRRIISESCEYIVDIASQLPAFTEQTFAEILKRENYLLDLAKRILDEIRKMREQTDPSLGAQQFELEYRRAVIRKLDSLELFGVNLPLARRRHRLSTAYISLSIEKKEYFHRLTNNDSFSIKRNEVLKRANEDHREIVSLETALADSQRLFIRGTAGSGKTTLLQWIAVNSAQQSFTEPLTTWNKNIPFYISLRHCVETGLPSPRDFPRFITSSRADTMPRLWVHKVLDLGNAIVLVDGLDEVPELQREDVRLWLKDLVESFPRAYYIITSRPGAVGAEWINWIEHERFDDAELQPMNLLDIRSFIDHWHNAVMAELDDEEEKDRLQPVANHLIEEITSTRSLGNLAKNPLLCAMLCALHRERREQLPSDRIKLYEVCCEMLIERRDSTRRISLVDYPAAALNYREKLVLLEDLAYWMVKNSWPEVELAKAEERFGHKLVNMHNITKSISRSDVRKLFVERTNLIREPIIGHIDFAHRTFQEYLAARAAIDEGDIGLLVKNAHDDQWQEVIILAAGLATKRVRESLLMEIMKRGDTEKAYKHQLHLLAISCLDTSIELEQNLKAELTERLSKLIPPKDLGEAKALAAAGELAVPYLNNNDQYTASISKACVRTLAIIGGDLALKALESYINDTRSVVIDELVSAWDYFDKKTYAQRILSNLPHTEYKPPANLTSLELFQYFRCLTTLNLNACQEISDLRPLANLTQLSHLDLRCPKISDLSPLANLTQLSYLDLRGCPKISDLSPLANLAQLSFLDLNNCERINDLSPLANLTRFSYLGLDNCNWVTNLSPLANLTQLNYLELRKCRQISDLSPLANLTQLNYLNVSDCQQITDLSPLANLSQLNHLDLRKCQNITDLSPLANLSQLNPLYLSGCEQLSDLSPLANLTQLSILDLSNCEQLSDLSPLANLTQLSSLILKGCPKITDLSPLANLTQLTHLDLESCGQITDLSPLANLTQLNYLELRKCQQIADLSPLANLTQLNYLNVSGCRQIADLSPLANLTRLNYLYLNDCYKITDLSPLANLSQLNHLYLSDGSKKIR